MACFIVNCSGGLLGMCTICQVDDPRMKCTRVSSPQNCSLCLMIWSGFCAPTRFSFRSVIFFPLFSPDPQRRAANVCVGSVNKDRNT